MANLLAIASLDAPRDEVGEERELAAVVPNDLGRGREILRIGEHQLAGEGAEVGVEAPVQPLGTVVVVIGPGPGVERRRGWLRWLAGRLIGARWGARRDGEAVPGVDGGDDGGRCSVSPRARRSFQCMSMQNAQPLICETRSLRRWMSGCSRPHACRKASRPSMAL
jgi:hypothetical protein